MMGLKKILVPIDFSKEAKLALEWAIKLGREENSATLCLLHVMPPVPITEREYETTEIVRLEWENAKKQLEEWRRKIQPPLSSITIVWKGNPAQKISEVCQQENIDLVVMTTQARHGLSRMAHPNLSEKIVRTVSCPVLVLHLNKELSHDELRTPSHSG